MRRRYGHNLFFYLLFVLGLFVFVPTAALLGVGMCASGVVAAGAIVQAHYAHVDPVFTPQPVPGKPPLRACTSAVRAALAAGTGSSRRALDAGPGRRTQTDFPALSRHFPKIPCGPAGADSALGAQH